MALPIDYDTVTVKGRYTYLDGTPAKGFVRFAGKVVAISSTTETIIIPTTVTAVLDDNGQFSIPVPATDDPNIQPNGWTYTVSEQLSNGGGRTYEIDVPLAAQVGGIDLSSVAPIEPAFGSPTAFVTLTEYETLDNRVSTLETNGGATGVTSVNTRTGAVTLTKSDVGLSSVDNTSDASKPVSTATQTALNAKQASLPAGTASQFLRGSDKTFVAVTKSDVGLANVDNTSDLNKPVSTAQQTALDGKQASLPAGTASQFLRGSDKTFVALTKGDVGLSNVDNTSDANKPVSTAQQTALDGKVDKSVVTAKGDLIAGTAASTVARLPLGTNGQALVIDTTTATGLKWAALTASNAVTSVAGRTGDVVLTKSDVGLANVDNTSDANKPVSTAQQTALNLKANDSAVVKLAAGAEQLISGDGTYTAIRAEVPYSVADTNADQWAFFNRNSANTSWNRITWLNGNFEFRSMPSSVNRIGFRSFEFAEASGGPSTGDFAQFSTNPTNAANREALLAVRGTGAATLPGWVTVSRGIDSPNIKPGSWVTVTYGAATAPTATYETPSSRIEPNGTNGGGRISLKGRIEIPANTGSGVTLFTLNSNHFPAKTRGFNVRTGGGNLACIMEINNAGQASLNVASGASASWVYLDGFNFAL